ncbi:MAG: heme NO-binding domain-containing protein [Planctomycetia bacterium]
MLGMVFTELLQMVEQQHSFAVADRIVERAGARGAYTSVGYYPDSELMALVEALSAETGTPVPELLRAYGRHLLGCFRAGFPAFFDEAPTAEIFLERLESHVHAEVRKLYATARPPVFELVRTPQGELVLDYVSSRGLADFAEGLLEGVLEHYRVDPTGLRREDLSGGVGTHVRFRLPRLA